MKNNVYVVLNTIVSCFLSESTYDVEFNHLLRGMEGIITEKLPEMAGLDANQMERMIRLTKLPAFRQLPNKIHGNVVSFLYFLDKIKF